MGRQPDDSLSEATNLGLRRTDSAVSLRLGWAVSGGVPNQSDIASLQPACNGGRAFLARRRCSGIPFAEPTRARTPPPDGRLSERTCVHILPVSDGGMEGGSRRVIKLRWGAGRERYCTCCILRLPAVCV